MLHAAMPHIRKRPDRRLEGIHAGALLRQARGNPVRGGPRVASSQTRWTFRTECDGMGERGLANRALLLDGRSPIAPCAEGEGR